MRLRMLFGGLGLAFGLALYALAVMAAAIRFLPDQATAELVFYALAGIAWIYPAARLTRWMQQAPPFRGPAD